MSYKKSGNFSESTRIQELKPLDANKIYRAKEMILESHPLSQIKLYEALPLLKPILKHFCLEKIRNTIMRPSRTESLLPVGNQVEESDSFKKKENSLKNKKSFVDKLKEKLRISGYYRRSSRNFDDPFIQYGYGVMAFFNLLKLLILLFIGLSLLSLPMIIINYSQDSGMSPYYNLARTTIGNLESASSRCFQAPLELNQIEIDCQGQMISYIVSAGVIPLNGDDDQRICHFQNPEKDDECYPMYESNLIKSFDKCAGQKDCSVSNFQKVFSPKQLSSTHYQKCSNSAALLFVQVKCLMPEETQKFNVRIGLITVCIGLFICLIYIFVIYFYYQINELDFILWDLQTVTANDYTIDLMLTQKIWKDYEEYQEINPILDQQRSEHLTTFLQNYIENHLESYAKEIGREELVYYQKLKVIMMQFDFQQGQLINLMIQRGQHIANLDFKKRRQTEAQINKYLIRSKQTFENPIKCFVTFEYTDGHNLFLQMSNDEMSKISRIHHGIEAETAPIPSNIIWQYRNKSRKEYFSKRFLSIIFIGFILLITMVGVFFIRQYGSLGMAPFKETHCDQIWNQYGDKLEYYAKFGFNESSEYFDHLWKQEVDQEDLNLVSCYCIQNDDTIFYRGFRNKFNITVPQKLNETEDQLSKQMCNRFEKNYLFANLIYYSSSETIVLLNFILRFVIIMIVKFIGFQTESVQTSRIMVFVFIVQFINTDLIILFMDADFSQSSLFLLGRYKGQYPDFTTEWYQTIGNTLINTMLFNVYWPVLEFFVFFMMREFLRLLDRGMSTCNTWKTKVKTIQKYVDLYSGPEYTIHYKYSAILNITFITFMFGAGIPILFPIALLSFINLYIMERLLVAYSYRRPPMLDETLNKLTIKILLYAPLLYCTFGFWMLDNVQTFDNKVGIKQNMDDHYQTNHNILTAFRFNHAQPLLILVSLFLLVAITRRWSMIWVRRMINLDPQILFFKPDQVSFIGALNEEQRRFMIKEEFTARAKFGIKKISDETMDKLVNSPYNEEAEMIGVMTYQILDNPIYQKNFQYVPETLDDRDKFIFDDWQINSLGQSDYVKKNLNTFYLPKQNKE